MTATISKGKLKAHMLQIFREIEESGEELIVTDRGRPVLKIVPVHRSSVEQLFADYAGKVRFVGDIDRPALDDELMDRLQQLADQGGQSVDDFIRMNLESLSASTRIADEERRQRALAVVGLYHTGDVDLAAAHDKYLAEAFEA